MKARIRWLGVPRVLGFLLVLVYHLFKDTLPGGFLGVDVFFTMSGFLITIGIIENFNKGGFNFFTFLKKRVVRIFPPLFLAIIYTLPFALLISPDFTVGILKQLAAAFGMVTNYYEISTGGSYEAQLLPHLYIHTWSLAVEIHFYLVWGIFCALLSSLLHKKIPDDIRFRRGLFSFIIFVTAVIAAVASYLFMLGSYKANTDTSAAYMSSVSHAFPFFIGAAAAVTGRVTKKFEGKPPPRKSFIITPIIAVTAILGIIIIARNLHFNGAPVFRYGFLAVSLLTVVIIYCARKMHCIMPSRKRESTLLVLLTNLSYDMYLFHWPLYIVFSSVISNNLVTAAVVVALTLIFSAVMFAWVEPIFQFKKKKAGSKKKTAPAKRVGYGVIAVCSAVMIFMSYGVVRKTPDISSIEEDFNSGNIIYAGTKISALKRWVSAINEKPLLSAKTLSKGLESDLPDESESPDDDDDGEDTEPEIPVSVPSVQGISVPGGVTIIGDSVCLGAQPTLTSTIADCYVDAAVSRFTPAGHAVMVELQERGSLAENVVIALGTNANSQYESNLTAIIDTLEPGHRLVFVTPFDGRYDETGWANRTAAWIRTLPGKYPFITVADWNAAIQTRQSLLAGDKVHLKGASGMNLYTDCVVKALTESQSKPVKK